MQPHFIAAPRKAPYLIVMDPLFYLPIVYLGVVIGSKALLGVAMHRLGGRYNNRHPRAQQDTLTGWGARAKAAHYNSYEAWPVFAVGLVAARFGGGDDLWIHGLSLIWIGLRVIYLYAYVADFHRLRTISWCGATLAACWMMVLPIL